jgi:Holliday junction DNA helicase RuvB
MFDNDDGFGLDDAMLLGTGFALYRHGQDAQTRQLISAIDGLNDRPESSPEEPDEPEIQVINAIEWTTAELPELWDDYIGQGPLKEQIWVALVAAQMRGDTLGHILLESGYPGVGKTTMARLIAATMKVPIIEVVPPFTIEAIIKAAMSLPDKGVLFIDEIHKMTDSVGAQGAEVLLKLLEDGVIFEKDGTVHVLHDITVVGATTEADSLPDTVLDRFKMQPYFQAYSMVELARITVVFVWKHGAVKEVSDEVIYAIARACRSTPRVAEKMVEACRDLSQTSGRQATPAELLAHIEVEPDGMTRKHVAYITSMRQYFGREAKDGSVEYIIGEAGIRQRLRETKEGIGRLERFLIERGLLDRTPRGRKLTNLGITRAENFIAEGKGVAHVA